MQAADGYLRFEAVGARVGHQLISWLTAWGFKQCVSDRYLFVCVQGASTLLLLIWVDDIFMGHNDAGLRGRFMEAFQKRFRVKDLGPFCGRRSVRRWHSPSRRAW